MPSPEIQELVSEVDSISPDDSDMIAKLNEIARRVAEEQRKQKAMMLGIPLNDPSLVDPMDEFACEGCQ